MIKNILALIMVLSFLISCGESKPKEKLINGFRTVVHNSTNGEKPNVGDYVFFNLDTYNDKREILDRSPRDENMPIYQITAPEEIQKNSSPIVELLGGLAIGDSASLYIPIDSFPQLDPSMVGAEYIEYVIEISKIMTNEEFEIEKKKRQDEQAAKALAAQEAAPKILEGIESTLTDYLAGKNVGEVVDGPEGLKIIIMEPGEGETANSGQTCTVNYAGYLEDLSNFDNSYKRGTPYGVALGRNSVIQGWEKGLVFLNKGAKAILDIPSDLGYGAAGNARIPADSRLLFHIEVIDIK